jgi:catechol 2,3-dioxygenase-like lactoylglutathione lyase family enzyme
VDRQSNRVGGDAIRRLEGAMGLSSAKVHAVIAVSDMQRAREFYEGQLGLTGGEDTGDGGHTYPCGAGTELHIFPGAGAGKSESTIAGITVDDIEATVDELAANGVTFERYDEPPLTTDEKGIATFDGVKGAWMKDPDGNVLALTGD